MTPEALGQLLVAECIEADEKGFEIRLNITLATGLSLCAMLQLALRHPGDLGEAGEAAREIVDIIREGVGRSGFPVTAEAIALGKDSANDERFPV